LALSDFTQNKHRHEDTRNIDHRNTVGNIGKSLGSSTKTQRSRKKRF
jgi:hypothetical protein